MTSQPPVCMGLGVEGDGREAPRRRECESPNRGCSCHQNAHCTAALKAWQQGRACAAAMQIRGASAAARGRLASVSRATSCWLTVRAVIFPDESTPLTPARGEADSSAGARNRHTCPLSLLHAHQASTCTHRRREQTAGPAPCAGRPPARGTEELTRSCHRLCSGSYGRTCRARAKPCEIA